MHLDSTSDTEVICALIAEHPGSLREATIEAMSRIRGAFAAVLLAPEAVIGFRDPDGIRPLVLGDLDGYPVLASETPALDIIGARAVRELEPGELAICDADGVHVEQAVAPRHGGEALCIFEHIYFARPDARMSGESLHAARERMGERLAVESPVDADVVIPVPDSGTPAAIGYARAAGLPFGDGLIKNRYVGRTFIQPNQELREVGLRLKFNPLPHVLEGKRVVVVDDSIVRGTTTRKIVVAAARGRSARGAPARLVAADRLALLLRDRHGHAGAADRGRPRHRRGLRAHRRRLARVPQPRGPADGDRAVRRPASAAPASPASIRSRPRAPRSTRGGSRRAA